MILRRFAEHLRKRDWTSVVIEILIVVLGVFIGLQVNDWGSDQAAKRRSHSASSVSFATGWPAWRYQ